MNYEKTSKEIAQEVLTRINPMRKRQQPQEYQEALADQITETIMECGKPPLISKRYFEYLRNQVGEREAASKLVELVNCEWNRLALSLGLTPARQPDVSSAYLSTLSDLLSTRRNAPYGIAIGPRLLDRLLRDAGPVFECVTPGLEYWTVLGMKIIEDSEHETRCLVFYSREAFEAHAEKVKRRKEHFRNLMLYTNQ